MYERTIITSKDNPNALGCGDSKCRGWGFRDTTSRSEATQALVWDARTGFPETPSTPEAHVALLCNRHAGVMKRTRGGRGYRLHVAPITALPTTDAAKVTPEVLRDYAVTIYNDWQAEHRKEIQERSAARRVAAPRHLSDHLLDLSHNYATVSTSMEQDEYGRGWVKADTGSGYRGVNLTPKQARALAQTLNDLADKAEDATRRELIRLNTEALDSTAR